MSIEPDSVPGSKIRDAVVIPKPSQGEMIELTKQFLRPNGAYDQLNDSINALKAHFTMTAYAPDYMGYLQTITRMTEAVEEAGDDTAREEIRRQLKETPKVDVQYATKPHLGAIPEEDYYDMLFGHNGLTGEFGNGVGAIHYMRDVQNSAMLDRFLKIFAEGIAGDSCLVKSPQSVNMGQRLGIVNENKLDALFRCERELRKWVDVNQDTLQPGQTAKFNELLDTYAKALAETKTYIDRMFAYTGKGQQQTVVNMDGKNPPQ